MFEIDTTLTRAINSLAGQSAAADLVMVRISAIGVPLLILGVILHWWRKDERQHTRHVVVAAGLTFIFGLGLNQAILLFAHRMRPYDAGLTHILTSPSADPSFPSDHATAGFAIALAFLLGGMRRTGFCFLAAAVLLSFSRIYIGTHYASDVAGGALTATVAALAVHWFYREGTRLDRLITNIL